MYGNSGADRFLEFQYHFTGDFYTMLFRAIAQADDQNLERLAKGFPEEVEAHVTWTLKGVAPCIEKVTVGHPLLKFIYRDHRTDPAVLVALGGYKVDQGDPITVPGLEAAITTGRPIPPLDEGDSDYDGGGPAGPGRESGL